jgi:hypothetical protein
MYIRALARGYPYRNEKRLLEADPGCPEAAESVGPAEAGAAVDGPEAAREPAADQEIASLP